MNKGPWARWKSWIAVDSDRPGASGSREARLDSMLRSSAAEQVGEGEGRLRWRVLGAVSAGSAAPHDNRSVVGRIGWRTGALAACALIAIGIGIGAIWFGPSAAQVGTPTADAITTSAPADGSRKLTALAFLQSPMSALAAQLDQPFERETKKLVTDAKRMATFFAERVTAPIAALHQATSRPESEAPAPDLLHSGGA